MHENLTPSRLAHRSSRDLNVIREILNQASVCTLSYSTNGQVVSIPTGFVLYENKIAIHGSVKSHFLEHMMGHKVCLSVFLLDGLVLAASAFHHSMNYRSVILYSEPSEVTDELEKTSIVRAFTEKIAPGRWDHLRPVTAGELKATRILTFSVEESSAKIRTGGPSEEKEDESFPVWTGVVSFGQPFSKPVPAEGKEAWDLPEHVRDLLK